MISPICFHKPTIHNHIQKVCLISDEKKKSSNVLSFLVHLIILKEISTVPSYHSYIHVQVWHFTCNITVHEYRKVLGKGVSSSFHQTMEPQYASIMM